MITFNVQASNGNYYRGHEPSNRGNCWDDEQHALVMTIEQARRLVEAWPGFLKIVISVCSEPISAAAFEHELFCARGGSWYIWRHRDRLRLQMACSHQVMELTGTKQCCSDCGAATNERGRWYDLMSGTMLDSDVFLGEEGGK